MIAFEDIALFEKAYADELSAEEQEAFTKRLREDGVFKTNFDKFKEVVEAIKEQQNYEDLMVVLNDCHKSRDWAAPGEPIVSTQRSVLPWLVALALVLAAVVATFFITRSIYHESEDSAGPVVEESLSPSTSPEPVNDRVDTDTLEHASTDLVSAGPEEWPNPTAFLIGQSGYFLTAYSAIADARSLRLRQNDTTDYKVEIVVYDPELDVAVLRLADGQWPREKRLPFRIATTQAFANTEVMAIGRDNTLDSAISNIDALEAGGSFKRYALNIASPYRFRGGPVISKNGNIVAIVTMLPDSTAAFVKSTHLVGMLARNANQPGMEDYIPAANNRLAGLQRAQQMDRVAPYILEVIRFY